MISWRNRGKVLSFFLPGMFVMDGRTGLYPAVSLTGPRCGLMCDHCRGRLLETMLPAETPEALLSLAVEMKKKGKEGFLVSGGSAPDGSLPYPRFHEVIREIIDRTGLTVTVHAGYLDAGTARLLKKAGVRQALVDVIGDEQTARRVYHLERGTAPVWETLDALTEAGLEPVPHVVVGLDYGRITGEYRAVERLAAYRPRRLVTVVLTPLSGTPMKGLAVPPPEDVAGFLVVARGVLPEAWHHLGCARPTGLYRRRLDRLAVRAGINAMALPSDEALEEAERLGLETLWRKTCCSLAGLETGKD